MTMASESLYARLVKCRGAVDECQTFLEEADDVLLELIQQAEEDGETIREQNELIANLRSDLRAVNEE